ncbi:helix-turn-helix transcriptional regulator [Streptomyces sp. NPDC007084]|uniref:helix-turn-helix domain-containing protein n=1 Tax=Streptomyces sp. NPDC007084 TaxID=3154313 RepID=UPI003452BE0B
MPAPVTAADLAAARTALGLSRHQLAEHVDSTPDAIIRWESGSSVVPPEIGEAVDRLVAYTNGIVEALTRRARQDRRLCLADVSDGGVFGRPLPESWRGMVMQRVAGRLAG